MTASNSSDAEFRNQVREELVGLLKVFQKSCDQLRTYLKFSRPHEVVARYTLDNDHDLVVTADGFGGATVEEQEGNFPVDYRTFHRREFLDEDAACEWADDLAEGNTDWDEKDFVGL